LKLFPKSGLSETSVKRVEGIESKARYEVITIFNGVEKNTDSFSSFTQGDCTISHVLAAAIVLRLVNLRIIFMKTGRSSSISLFKESSASSLNVTMLITMTIFSKVFLGLQFDLAFL